MEHPPISAFLMDGAALSVPGERSRRGGGMARDD
jgi:hypothetical protein